MGALLAAIIGLPMGLAFGVQSGLGPQAGIYTAILLAFIASIFGGTKTLITDPTGPMTVVAATVVTMGISRTGDLELAWPIIICTFVLAGFFQTLLGIFDVGRFVKFMPYPVLSGFMAGIGVIIISVQLFPLLGHPSPKGFVNIVAHLQEPVTHLNSSSLLLGLLSIALIYLLPLISKRLPAILISIIICTALSVLLNLDVPIIGEIPRQLPQFHAKEFMSISWADLPIIMRPAIMLAGLGVIDSLLTSVVADNLTKTKHNSRWTVIGQGIGNLVTGFFGGIPGAGATMGTVTNIKAGASSKLSGVMKGVFLLIIIVGVADYVSYIPMSVLAGVLITIGIGIIDTKGVQMLFKVPKQDSFVWILVLAVTLLDNLLDAVGVGFTISAILFIGKMVKSMAQTQKGKNLDQLVRSGEIPSDLAQSIHVLNLEGPLFFGFADRFRIQCEQITDVLAVVLRMHSVPFLDQSGLVTLESVIADWHKRGIQVYLCGANTDILERLEKVEVVPQVIHKDHIYGSLKECILDLSTQIEHKEDHQDYDEILLSEHILAARKDRLET